MSPLVPILLRQIASQGPLSVAEYMAMCLLHPEYGYYTTRDPFGDRGDFITAPEISQVFGELIGLCLAACWQDRGSPSRFVVAELGPGRGSLMSDLLRATRGVPGFHAAMQIHLVEVSPVMRARQAAVLADHAPVWHNGIDSLPDLPLFAVANEFLDALPIRQFLRDDGFWRERVIGQKDGELAFGLTEPTAHKQLSMGPDEVQHGDMIETCAPAAAMVHHLSERIARQGGSAILIDYGSDHSRGDTLQAVRGHEKVSPLFLPGECDLTAHVRFGPLAKIAACPHSALIEQGKFLERLGCGIRHQALARNSDTAVAARLERAYRRLTGPAEMGQLFKVLALYSNDGPAPPGTDP